MAGTPAAGPPIALTDSGSAPIAGLDLERFQQWYERQQPGDLQGPLTATLVVGGKSNLTYHVTDRRTHRIVRRPPLGHVQDTAHDMSREYAVMKALSPTAVPVPEVFALCTDTAVLGTPFYVMDRVEGTAYRKDEQLIPLGPRRTAAIADNMIDVLARLHSVDPESVGLHDFGRPQGFVARQVRRWGRQLEGSRSRELPDAEELLRRLTVAVATGDPVDTPVGIVHGDYRLDNLLVSAQDEVVAVIDWEMATLGDTSTDLALMLVYDRLARMTHGAGAATASLAPGYPSMDHLLQRYEGAVGRSLGRMDVHLGLAYLKLAVILEGIHFRHQQGQTMGTGFDSVGESVQPLLAAGLEVTRALR